MSVTVPLIALATMAVLALIASERNYRTTSAGLTVMTGALLAWFAASYWTLGF
jgi:hypothetical protein